MSAHMMHIEPPPTSEETMRALLIPALPRESVQVIDIEPGLESLRAVVGGDIQVIGINGHELYAYLNEEGKLLGLPRNDRATLLTQRTGSVHAHDIIVGNTVIFGPADRNGNDTAVPEHELKWALAMLGQSSPSNTCEDTK